MADKCRHMNQAMFASHAFGSACSLGARVYIFGGSYEEVHGAVECLDDVRDVDCPWR